MVFDRRETLILLVGDFVMLVVSLWMALLIRNLEVPSLGYFEANVIPFSPMFLLSLAVFYVAGLYEKPTRPTRSVMGIRIFGAQVATVAMAAILFFLLPFSIAPKTILVLYLFVSVITASLWRFHRMNREVAEGSREPAVLIGSGRSVSELYDEVVGNDWYRIRFVAHHETKALQAGEVYTLVASLIDQGIRIIVIDMSDPTVVRDLPDLYRLMTRKVTFFETTSLYEEIFDRVPLEYLDTAQLLESLPRHRTLYDSSKRFFDIILALVLALFAIPFIGAAALVLVVTGGTPFILNERIGRGGRIFQIIKLRTMLFNDHGNADSQKKNRVTAFGRILRKTRIDELPQLWNIFMGDLSFIGPRPELPKIAEVYERELPQYRLRHLVTPGLSGWAQIRDYDAPRGPADVEKTRRKLSFDLYYLKHRSFALDLAIALKTLRALVSLSGT